MVFFCFLRMVPLQSQIKTIVIDGNLTTRASIIHREFGYTPGETLTYNDSLLGVWKMRLESTRLFNWVSLEQNKAGDTLRVKVVERWYVWIQPEGDFLERNFNAWWEQRNIYNLSIGGTVFANNLMGKQESFFIRRAKGFMAADGYGFIHPFQKFSHCNAWKVQIDNSRSRRVGVNSEGNKMVLQEHWGYRQMEQLQFLAEYKRRFVYKWQGVVRFKYLRDYASQNVEAKNPEYFIAPLGNVSSPIEYWKQNTPSLYSGWIRDTRNQTNYPTKGSEWKGGMAIGRQKSGGEVSPYFEIESKYRGFYSLGPHTSLAFMAQCRYRFGDLSYQLQRQMGYGMEYVRGYESFVFDGAGLILGKAAWRYQFLGNHRAMFLRFLPRAYEKVPIQGWFNIFADVGRTLSPYQISQNPMSNQTLKSLGMGLDLLCYYDALARMDYSYNPSLRKWVFNLTFYHAI
jgi:outer membrane protein assembly factor BamA